MGRIGNKMGMQSKLNQRLLYLDMYLEFWERDEGVFQFSMSHHHNFLVGVDIELVCDSRWTCESLIHYKDWR